MAAMGGSVEEARRYVDRMKKQTERENEAIRESDRRKSKNWYEANKDSRQKGFAVYYEDNIEKVIKKRMEAYEANKETEKAYFRDYHEAKYHLSTG